MNDDVKVYLDGIAPAKRRQDADVLLDLMHRATREDPEMWKGMVGFGEYHYRYASGREGDAPAAAFAARKAAFTIYLSDGVSAHEDSLARLGAHSSSVGCLYVKALDDVDLEVLESIVARSYQTLTTGTFTDRARDSG